MKLLVCLTSSASSADDQGATDAWLPPSAKDSDKTLTSEGEDAT